MMAMRMETMKDESVPRRGVVQLTFSILYGIFADSRTLAPLTPVSLVATQCDGKRLWVSCRCVECWLETILVLCFESIVKV